MATTDLKNRTERLFLALFPDDAALAEISARMAAMKQEPWSKNVRWIPGINIHMTLRFFGETKPEAAIFLTAELGKALQDIKSFDISLSRLLFLPSAARARVVAVGSAPSAGLENLARTVEETAVRCGFEPERKPFKAHITIGRARELDVRRAETQIDFSGIVIPVPAIHLVKSTLTQSGAMYDIVHSFRPDP
jgi:2'-5' RNA ligase